MKPESIFLRMALATFLVLLIPFIAMQFRHEVNWSYFDFILMGLMIFTTGSLIVVTLRKVNPNKRIFIVITFLFIFLFIWAELAVGVFTQLGK